MSSSSRLIGNAATSVVQAVVSGLVLFFLYRYLLEELGAEQLGLWSVVMASTSVARLSELGITRGVVKFVAKYRALESLDEAGAVVQTAALVIATAMAGLLLIGYPLFEYVLLLALPATANEVGAEILPWAVFSLWLTTLGGVFQSGLDGCQRMDIRNAVMLAADLVLLAMAFYLVPVYGIQGMAMAQAIQGTVVVISSWILLRRFLYVLPLLPWRGSVSKLREMLGYSITFQVNAVAILLFEPTIKLLMGRLGGLESAAFYEMAQQFVTKLRGLIVAALQAVVPTIAELHETEPEKVRGMYSRAYRLVYFFAIPLFAILAVSLPLVSELWIGRQEPQFLLFGLILSLAWGINTLNGPAYFVNLGTGHLKWNTIAHVAIAMLNAIIGFTMGLWFGSLGVAFGAMIALVLGSMLIVAMIHRQFDIPLREALPSEHMPLTFVTLISAAVALSLRDSGLLGGDAILAGSCSLAILVLAIGFVVWRHPCRARLIHKLRFG